MLSIFPLLSSSVRMLRLLQVRLQVRRRLEFRVLGTNRAQRSAQIAFGLRRPRDPSKESPSRVGLRHPGQGVVVAKEWRKRRGKMESTEGRSDKKE